MKLQKMTLPAIVGLGLPPGKFGLLYRQRRTEAIEVVRHSPMHSAISALALRFQLCIWIGLSILAPIIILSGSIMPNHTEVSDPFLAVSDLFNGDVREVALAQGFTCQNPHYHMTLSDVCTRRYTNQIYSEIYVEISGNRVKEIDLPLRENTIALGDLVLLWGKPEICLYCDTMVVSWSAHRITAMVAIPKTRSINYFAPIGYISFLGEGLPYWEQPLLNELLHDCRLY